MKFSYDNLKLMERHGDRVGNWKGLPVFSSRKMNISEKASGAFFIVYDDDNVIVKRDNGVWYCYGQVSASGQVEECSKRRYNAYAESVYCHDTQAYEPPALAVCGKPASKCDGTAAAAHDGPIGDVKIGIDVDAVLQYAREMTVDSLLEGFNYGLEAKG